MAKKAKLNSYVPPPVREGRRKREEQEKRAKLLRDAAENPVTPKYAPFEITEERIKEHYAAVGFFDFRKLFRPDWTLKSPEEWDDETAYALAGLDLEELWGPDGTIPDVKRVLGVVKKFKMSDKLRALRDLAEMKGMLKGGEDDRKRDKLAELIKAIEDSPK